MNNVLTSGEGLSSAIQSIQEELYSGLSNLWLGDIEGFGRVYKNIENSSDDIPKYYKSAKIFIAEVFNSNKGDYQDVYYDDNKSSLFCFLISNKDDTEDQVLFKNKVKVVFMIDLSKIYPSSNERQDSKAEKDAVGVLRDINGSYIIGEIQRGIDNVFSEYTTNKIRFNDLHPFHVFSVNIELNYYLTDKCI
jgi:hypothetical protein